MTTAGMIYINYKTNDNKTEIIGRYATKTFTKDKFQSIVNKIEGRG